MRVLFNMTRSRSIRPKLCSSDYVYLLFGMSSDFLLKSAIEIHYRSPRKLIFSVGSVILFRGGPHVIITHDALYLTVQILPPRPQPAPPPDIRHGTLPHHSPSPLLVTWWWPSLEICSKRAVASYWNAFLFIVESYFFKMGLHALSNTVLHFHR